MPPLDIETVDRVIVDEIYGFLQKEGILTEGQKGCSRKSRGTWDQLYIAKLLLQEVKRGKKTLAIGWSNYCKAYGMVPHFWVIERSNMMTKNVIEKNVVNFFGKSDEVLEGGANLWC